MAPFQEGWAPVQEGWMAPFQKGLNWTLCHVTGLPLLSSQRWKGVAVVLVKAATALVKIPVAPAVNTKKGDNLKVSTTK